MSARLQFLLLGFRLLHFESVHLLPEEVSAYSQRLFSALSVDLGPFFEFVLLDLTGLCWKLLGLDACRPQDSRPFSC